MIKKMILQFTGKAHYWDFSFTFPPHKFLPAVILLILFYHVKIKNGHYRSHKKIHHLIPLTHPASSKSLFTVYSSKMLIKQTILRHLNL